MRYRIKVSLRGANIWVNPSQVDPRLNDIEPSLNHAIRAERFFRVSFGFDTRREKHVESVA